MNVKSLLYISEISTFMLISAWQVNTLWNMLIFLGNFNSIVNAGIQMIFHLSLHYTISIQSIYGKVWEYVQVFYLLQFASMLVTK